MIARRQKVPAAMVKKFSRISLIGVVVALAAAACSNGDAAANAPPPWLPIRAIGSLHPTPTEVADPAALGDTTSDPTVAGDVDGGVAEDTGDDGAGTTEPSGDDTGTSPAPGNDAGATTPPPANDAGATTPPPANDAGAAHDSGATGSNDAGATNKDSGAPQPPPVAKGKIVAYYATWTRSTMPPSSIPWGSVTHIAHAFVLPSATGGLVGVSSYVDAELISAAHAHGVKVVASVGGAGANFAAMSEPTTRAQTIADMTRLCRTYGYDGIDIDWEFPTPSTVASWSALITELRASLDTVRPGLTISAAVGSGPSDDLAQLPTPSLTALDWIGVMTYDYAGPWSSSSGHNSPIHRTAGGDGGYVDESISYLVGTRGLPASKVFVGLPFYGYQFGASAVASTPVAPSVTLDYREIVALPTSAGWARQWDATGSVPFLARPASPGFVSYDDSTSIAAKCNYAKGKQLGGAIVWHLAGDRLPNGTNPLLAAAQGCR